MADIETPVLIVGGGGCGLSSSLFLSHAGISSVLVERHPRPSPMPKARHLNQRSTDIFRQHGLADAIYTRAFPLKNMSKRRWCTSLGGDSTMDGKVLFAIEAFGGGGLAAHYRANSPCEGKIYPQVRLEPLMHEFPESRSRRTCCSTNFRQPRTGFCRCHGNCGGPLHRQAADDAERFKEDKLIPRMRAPMKIPDPPAKVLSLGHWIVQGVLADRYRFGRVFLAGDAAHRQTPTTG